MKRWLSLLWFGLPIAACTGTPTTTGFAPITSIILHADAIIPAAQCGTGANQIAKYTAVVSACADSHCQESGLKVLSGQTYDCYADALFANMLGVNFTLDVYEWSSSAYTAAMNPMNGALPIASVETMLHSQCDANVPCQSDYKCFGTCVPGCDTKDCTTIGFACDGPTKACIANPRPCTLTTDCTGTNVCVQGRCVAPCGNTLPCVDANGVLDPNQVCVAGGCVPDGGQPAAGRVQLMKHTPTLRKQCFAYQTSNVQAVAQCSVPDAGVEASTDAAGDATSDAPGDATGN